MSDNDPQQPNIQAGQALTPGNDPAAEPVETGSRRDRMHYEPDPDQLVVARSLVRPDHELPPQEQSFASEYLDRPAGPPVADVRVAPEGSSVWDARPPPDDEDKSGEPTGH